QPGGRTGGTAWTTDSGLEVQDAGGNTVTTDTSTVTVAIANNAGAGTLSGTLTKAAVAGVASFSANALKIDKIGTGYTLSATDGSLTGANSSGFNITVGSPVKLAFTTSPSASTVAGVAFATQPVVTVQDAGGNTITTDTSTVTVAILNNPGSGTLGGTVTKTAVAGVASFSGNGLNIDKVGSSYTLTATEGSLTSATSGSFNITVAAAAKLVFGVQPSTTLAGSAISPAVTVIVQDQFGNTVTSSSSSVTITSTTTAFDGTSTLAVNASSGVATFSNIKPT